MKISKKSHAFLRFLFWRIGYVKFARKKDKKDLLPWNPNYNPHHNGQLLNFSFLY